MDAMAQLVAEWQRADAVRVAVLVRGECMTMLGRLRHYQVAEALGVSEPTWHRWRNEFGLRQLAIECVAEIDQALRSAGADESTTLDQVKGSPDAELALLNVGVVRR